MDASLKDFAGYSDTLILGSSFAVCTLITGAIVGVEISWKLAFGQNLIGTSHTYVYMGMQVIFFVICIFVFVFVCGS